MATAMESIVEFPEGWGSLNGNGRRAEQCARWAISLSTAWG